jgi:hypothetical protein
MFTLHPSTTEIKRACSLRVAVVGRVVIIDISFFFAVAFVFLLVSFLVWLLSKEDIGS